MYRRGAKEADGLILELVRIADAVRGDTNRHMAHEEQEVLPLLEAHLCAAEQRAMVWAHSEGDATETAGKGHALGCR